jgi:PAS domain S-box-containing protein
MPERSPEPDAAPKAWRGLFITAFRNSANAMALLDTRRCVQAVNPAFLRLVALPRNQVVGRKVWELVEGGPLLSNEDWERRVAEGDFTGSTVMLRGDGGRVTVQWGAHTEVITGERLVLFVALSTSRWGGRFRRDGGAGSAAPLTRREREVVDLVALGRSGPEIAEELHIAHDTVRTHVRNAMEKVGARSRAQLVAKALGEGHTLEPAPVG